MSRSTYYPGMAQDRSGASDGSTADEDSRRGETGRLTRLVACRRVIMESFGNAHTVSEESRRWVSPGRLEIAQV